MPWSSQLYSTQIKAVNSLPYKWTLCRITLGVDGSAVPILAPLHFVQKSFNITSSFKFLLIRTLADFSCDAQRDSCPNETLSNTCRRLMWRQIVLPSLRALCLNPQRFKHLIITLQATLIGAFQCKRSFPPSLLISLWFFVAFAAPAVYTQNDIDGFLYWQTVLWKLVKAFTGIKTFFKTL